MLGKFLQKPEDLIKAFKEELYKHDYDEKVLFQLLETRKFSINHQNKKGDTFLHLCLVKDKFKSSAWLIEQGAKLDIENINKISPIFLLIEKKHLVLLEMILKRDLIDVNKKDEYGRTLLQNAVVLGYSEVAELFIEYGADVNSKDNNNRHVLFDALSFGDKKFIKHLLSCDDLELDVIDANHESIMHHPQVRKDDENAIDLLEAGANATIKIKKVKLFFVVQH
jgi:ankyrin repeat protein